MPMFNMPKVSMYWNKFNKTNSVRMLNTAMGKSYMKWAAVGAGLGAVRGVADNIVGEDRVSVLGGAMQGAMMGMGARGVRSAWTGDITARASRLRRLRGVRGTRASRASMGDMGWGSGGDIY